MPNARCNSRAASSTNDYTVQFTFYCGRSLRTLCCATEANGPGVDQSSSALPSGLRAIIHNPAHSLRSEEHTSELQSLMRISYAVLCLKKKHRIIPTHSHDITHILT